MKTCTTVLILLFIFTNTHAQEKRELKTEITHVTVFSIGAQIHRAGNMEVMEGKTLIRLIGLTPDMDPKSVQVKVNDEVTILSVAHEWNTSSAANNTKNLDSLNRIFSHLDKVAGQLQMRSGVLDQKLNLLTQNSNLRSETSGVTSIQLESALTLFEATWMSANQEKLLIGHQLDSLERLKAETTKQIAVIRGTPLISKSEIEVLVITDHSTSAQLEISYIVKNAGWIPKYDIRAKDVSQPIVVMYKAEVHQQTGEVWKNVKLSLSSASPYTRQTAPELQTWKLTTLANTTFRRIGPSEHAYGTGMVTGRVTDVETGEPLIFANVMVSGHPLGTQTDMNGDFSILLPQGASSLEVSYTGYTSQTVAITKQLMSIRLKSGMQLESVEIVGSRNRATDYYTDGVRLNSMSKAPEQLTVIIENQVSVEFELKNLTTILSDGKNSSLEVQTYEIPAAYHYETAPKADRGAYLIATLTNWEKYYLIEGQANLYFKNTYIGKTILDPLNLSDTLEISLGRDPEVLVERIKEDEFTKKTFLGTNTIIEKNFKLTFRNKKPYPIRIQVFDQVPVSVNDVVDVTVTGLSGGILDEKSGIIKWDFSIDPTSNKELYMSYAVKYPSKERVVLE